MATVTVSVSRDEPLAAVGGFVQHVVVVQVGGGTSTRNGGRGRCMHVSGAETGVLVARGDGHAAPQ